MKVSVKWTVLPLLFAGAAFAQTSVGLQMHTPWSTDSGYVLFAPMWSKTTYLLDKCGRMAHSWTSTRLPNLSVYLLPDGTLLRPGYADSVNLNAGGVIERLDWDGNVIWHYTIADSVNQQHHDVCLMPNGNILVVARDVHSLADAQAQGRNPAVQQQPASEFDSEQLIEIRPIGADSGEVVWRWRAWDHMVQQFDSTKPGFDSVAGHPELLNINYPVYGGLPGWLHMNAVTYNPALDQVMVSCYNFSELWIIDHSTTTAQAASHTGGKRHRGGDLLYRYGNPDAYNRLGPFSPRQFYGVHDPEWVPAGYPHAGDIMVYNNGVFRPGGNYSSVDRFTPPIDNDGDYRMSSYVFGPAWLNWSYFESRPFRMYSPFISGAQPLRNGNVMICEGGTGVLREVDSSHHLLWKYVNPVAQTGPVDADSLVGQRDVFRCLFYSYSYSAFAGHSLVSGDRLELHAPVDTCVLNLAPVSVHSASPMIADDSFACYPSPAVNQVTIASAEPVKHVCLYNSLGQCVFESDATSSIPTASLENGIYSVVITHGESKACRMIAVSH